MTLKSRDSYYSFGGKLFCSAKRQVDLKVYRFRMGSVGSHPLLEVDKKLKEGFIKYDKNNDGRILLTELGKNSSLKLYIT